MGALLAASVLAPVSIALPAVPPAVAITIPATANIFRAGGNPPASDGSGGEGTAPPSYMLVTHGYELVTFSQVIGKVNAGIDPLNGPRGRTDFNTDLSPVGGISGTKANNAMFLAGVFPGKRPPKDPPQTETHTLTPQLGQVFFIGYGGSSTRGRPSAFVVPAGATQLYLGLADGTGFSGIPGAYGDNAGSFSAEVLVAQPSRAQLAERRAICQRALGETQQAHRFGLTWESLLRERDTLLEKKVQLAGFPD